MGCNTSKDGKETSSKPGSHQSPKKGQSAAKHGSPQKSAKQAIKAVADKDLQGVKLSSLPQFVRLGKLDMVHALIQKHHLSTEVIDIRGLEDEWAGP